MTRNNQNNVLEKSTDNSHKSKYNILSLLFIFISVISYFILVLYNGNYIFIPITLALLALLFALGGNKLMLIVTALYFSSWVALYAYIRYDLYMIKKNASLIEAIWSGDPQLVEKKIKENYDVNMKDSSGRTMLTLCFYFSFRDRLKTGSYWRKKKEYIILEMYRSLIENGADVNTLDGLRGWAPLHYVFDEMANLYNDTSYKVVEISINNGADVNILNKEGDTPLHKFVDFWGSFEAAELLIKNGADVNVKNNEGKIPLQIALEKMKENENYKEVVDFLRKHGAK